MSQIKKVKVKAKAVGFHGGVLREVGASFEHELPEGQDLPHWMVEVDSHGKPIESEEPKAPKAPKEPKAPKAPKAPKEPKAPEGSGDAVSPDVASA